jgi:galactonate dehydratase
MRITQLERFTVPPRWLFLKVSTDEGIVGWGEPVVEGRADTVAAKTGHRWRNPVWRLPDGTTTEW